MALPKFINTAREKADALMRAIRDFSLGTKGEVIDVEQIPDELKEQLAPFIERLQPLLGEKRTGLEGVGKYQYPQMGGAPRFSDPEGQYNYPTIEGLQERAQERLAAMMPQILERYNPGTYGAIGGSSVVPFAQQRAAQGLQAEIAGLEPQVQQGNISLMQNDKFKRRAQELQAYGMDQQQAQHRAQMELGARGQDIQANQFGEQGLLNKLQYMQGLTRPERFFNKPQPGIIQGAANAAAYGLGRYGASLLGGGF